MKRAAVMGRAHANAEGVVVWADAAYCAMLGERDPARHRVFGNARSEDDLLDAEAVRELDTTGAVRRGVPQRDARHARLLVAARATVDALVIEVLDLSRAHELRDDLERRAAVVARDHARDRYELVLDLIDDAFADIDLVGRRVTLTRGLARLLDETPGEAPTDFESWRGRLHPDDVERVVAKFARQLEGGGHRWRDACRLMRASGAYAEILLRAAILRDPDGTPTRVIIAVADATPFRRAVDHLERLASIVDTTSDFVFVAKLDGTIVHSNPAARALTTGEEYGPDHLQRVYPPERWSALEREHVPHVLARGSMEGETELIAKDGERIRVSQVLVGVSEADGRIDHVAIVARDLRDVLALRAELEQAQKLEAIGRLAGGVAHEFNNLLTSILGHAEALRETFVDDPRVRDDLLEIARAARRGSLITKHLLALGQRGPARTRTFDVRGALTGVLRLLERLVSRRQRIELEIADGLWLARFDETQLEQVLINLVVNAREAMADGGTVRIRAENAAVDRAHRVGNVPIGDYVVISVSDNGVGIDEASQQRIFEPFYTSKQQGTGLGLATVRSLLEQGGGGVTLTSRLGQGATFRVYLPRGGSEVESTGTIQILDVPSPKKSAEKTTILVVEDEPEVRRLLVRLLERQGFAVLSAENGPVALNLVRAHGDALDLVLSDVVMPGWSGPKLAEEILRERPHTRVIFMSGYPRNELDGRPRFEVDYLKKPFTPTELFSCVRSALAGPPP